MDGSFSNLLLALLGRERRPWQLVVALPPLDSTRFFFSEKHKKIKK
jgi:hypothetical protein